MRVLNLYAGIGGNRALWPPECEVTAVELVPEIAEEYRRRFPQDTVIVGDAHEYLLANYAEFDFIWSSPPCPTHSRTNYFLKGCGIVRYPDVRLYQEIILLRELFEGRFCVENVISYYDPLIQSQKVGRHYLWANFTIPPIKQPPAEIGRMNGKYRRAHKKPLTIRNQTDPRLGLHVMRCAFRVRQEVLA